MKKMLMVLIVLLFVAACGPKTLVCPDGTVVTNANDCPSVQDAQDQLDQIQNMADDLPTTIDDGADDEPVVIDEPATKGPLDPKIQELIDKTSKVKSYMYGYAPVKFESGQWTAVEQDVFHVRGDKVKIELLEPMTIAPKTFYNYVFYTVGGTPRGFCINEKLNICEADVVERDGTFTQYVSDLPETWLDRIPEDATMRSGPMKWNRQTKLVEFEEDGKYYALFLDSFFGMPMEVSIYEDAERLSRVGGAEYRDMDFNTVLEEDVALPN